MQLALFDFDGTLTHRDSFRAFVRYTCGPLSYYAGLLALSPVLSLYATGILRNDKAKEKFLRYFYKGWTREQLESDGESFSRERLPGLIRAEAWAKLQWHRSRQHDIYVVTASLSTWVKPWCLHHGIECIATEPQYQQDRFTGKLGTPNCHGEEKVRRIRAAIRLDQYSRIHAYGDSPADRPMLGLADEAYYQKFS